MHARQAVKKEPTTLTKGCGEVKQEKANLKGFTTEDSSGFDNLFANQVDA